MNVVGVPRWASPSADGKLTVTGEPRWKMAAPSDLAAWSNFVSRLVSRCRGRVSDWEIGNEPGHQSAFWTTGSPEDFAAYLKTAYIAAHAADPACRVYPGAPLDAHFLQETVAAAGGVADFDTLSVHYLGNAKRFSSKAAGWRALRDAIAPGLAIVNSEDMDWHSERGSGPLAVASAMVKLHVRDAAAGAEAGAHVFGYRVSDPERYGVVEFNENRNVVGLEEKPAKPKSDWAVPGLYFYGRDVVEKARAIRPSARGELEITDLNLAYMREGRLKVEPLGRGIAWLDTGTYGSLLEASNFVETIQNRQGLRIACLEEIAYDAGWLSRERLVEAGRKMAKNDYGRYLLKLAGE